MDKSNLNSSPMQTREEYDILMKCAKQSDEWHIIRALEILEGNLRKLEELLTNPKTVAKYLTLKLASLEHEVFGILFLDIKNRLIADEQMFRGTLTHCCMYQREVVKEALKHNAGAVILYHNHPSGVSEPSAEDFTMTTKLKKVLELVDVKIVDHIIVSGMNTFSFKEKGHL